MFKKISLVLASLVLSIGSGCVSAPNAANALTPDKAGCRKDAMPGDYVACLQVLSQQRQLQGGGFAAGGPAPAPTNTAPLVDQGSAPPPGGMPMGPGGGFGLPDGGTLLGSMPMEISPPCTNVDRKFQVTYINVPGLAVVPRGKVVICAAPSQISNILVDGQLVPAIPGGATVTLSAVLPEMCFTEAGYGNHACRVTDLEFDAYRLVKVAYVDPRTSRPVAGSQLSGLWYGKWRPNAPFRDELGATAFMPHRDRPDIGILAPNRDSFGRQASLFLLDVLEHSGQGEALKKLLPPGLVS